MIIIIIIIIIIISSIRMAVSRLIVSPKLRCLGDKSKRAAALRLGKR